MFYILLSLVQCLPFQGNDTSLPSFQFLANSFENCPSLKPRSVPTSVYDLRPDDFKIIMAMGDSITAALHASVPWNPQFANAAFRKTQVSKEDRGLSFVTGADPDTFSLAHALLHYNPNLKGMSHGSTKSTFCFGPLCLADSFLQPVDPTVLGLDAALSGSWTLGMDMNRQMSYLQQQLPKYGSPEDWKLLVIEIGFNDLCLVCHSLLDDFLFSAQKYEADLNRVLTKLKSQHSHLFVVLTSPNPLSELVNMVDKDPVCVSIRQFNHGCDCIDNPTPQKTAIMDDYAHQYHLSAQKVVKEWQSKGDPLFGVVYDSGLFNLDTTNGIVSDTLSGWDCFHPSKASHSKMGAGVFNNLIKPDDQKSAWIIGNKPSLTCLQENDRVWYPKP